MCGRRRRLFSLVNMMDYDASFENAEVSTPSRLVERFNCIATN